VRDMEWDERVWNALKDAITGMPPFVRRGALEKIVRVSEERARERGSDVVEESDLLKAVDTAVPGPIKPMCKRALKDAGVE